MKRLLYGLIAVLSLLAGCQHMDIRYSKVIKERVIVKDLLFTPSMHGSAVGPTYHMNMSGELKMGVAITRVNVPEQRNIIFECQHGSFIISRPDLWQKLHQDSIYTCLYREVYLVYASGNVTDSTVFQDYDFLGLEEFPKLVDPVTPNHRLR